MGVPGEALASDVGGAISSAAVRDTKLFIKAGAFVMCFAVLCALIYLIVAKAIAPDPYTTAEATRDWKANAETRNTNLKALAEQRAADLKAQAEINSLWREQNARNAATLDSLDRRTQRIETKLDSK